MTNLALYMIGFLLLIAGLAYGAHLVGIGQHWILVGVLILLGIGLATGVGRTRMKEKPPLEE
jgi:hypothetical protein